MGTIGYTRELFLALNNFSAGIGHMKMQIADFEGVYSGGSCLTAWAVYVAASGI